MRVGEACTRNVAVIERDESGLQAAKLMRELHVGDLVIVREDGGLRFPEGIVTDRDLTMELLALEVDPESVAVGDLFASPRLVTAGVDDELETALEQMRSHGVRRLPVVERDGSLAGILTVDDVLDLITEQLTDIIRLISNQRLREERFRR